MWFDPCVEDWASCPELRFDPENKWWKEHYRLVRDIRALAGDDFYIGIPDLMENIDVLASLRGTQDTVFTMIDEPEELRRRIAQVDSAYFAYYDRFYNVVKSDADGGSCYTVFQIWGFDQWIRGAERIIQKYGSRGLFLMFPAMSLDEAERLLEYGEKNWKDIEGSFR